MGPIRPVEIGIFRRLDRHGAVHRFFGLVGTVGMVGMVMVIIIVPIVRRIGIDRMGPVDAAVVAVAIPQIFASLIRFAAPFSSFDHRFDLFFRDTVLFGRFHETIPLGKHTDIALCVVHDETVAALFVAIRGRIKGRYAHQAQEYHQSFHSIILPKV